MVIDRERRCVDQAFEVEVLCEKFVRKEEIYMYHSWKAHGKIDRMTVVGVAGL